MNEHFSHIITFLKKKKKTFSQLLAPLFLILGSASLGKDNGTEPIYIVESEGNIVYKSVI